MECRLSDNLIVRENIFLDLILGLFPGIIFLISAYDWKFEYDDDEEKAKERFKKDKINDINIAICSYTIIILLNLYGIFTNPYRLISAQFVLFGYAVSLFLIIIYKQIFAKHHY